MMFPGDIVVRLGRCRSIVLWTTPYILDATNWDMSFPLGSLALVIGTVQRDVDDDIHTNWCYILCQAGCGWSQSVGWKRVLRKRVLK